MSDKKGGHDDHKKDDEHGKDKPRTEGEEKAKGIVGSLLESLLQPFAKFLPKKNLNILISLLNPWLDDSAEASALKVKQWLGEHPWLKDKKVGSALGALSAKIEDEADKYDEPTRVALKKISDWIQTFTSELRKDSGEYGEETSHSTGSSSTERAKKFDAGDAKLAEDGLDLILTAPPSGLDNIRAINRGRANAWHEHKETVKHGPPKPKEEKEPGVPFSEMLHEVGEAVGGSLKSFNSEIEKEIIASKERTARKQAEQKAEREAEPMTLQRKLRRLLF